MSYNGKLRKSVYVGVGLWAALFVSAALLYWLEESDKRSCAKAELSKHYCDTIGYGWGNDRSINKDK